MSAEQRPLLQCHLPWQAEPVRRRAKISKDKRLNRMIQLARKVGLLVLRTYPATARLLGILLPALRKRVTIPGSLHKLAFYTLVGNIFSTSSSGFAVQISLYIFLYISV